MSVVHNSVVVRIKNLFFADTRHVTQLLGAVIFLTVYGLSMVLSASAVTSGLSNDGNQFADMFKQAGAAVLGFLALFILSKFPRLAWNRFAVWGLVGGVGLQMLVFTSMGVTYGGNTNWVDLGFTTVQPSEFIKLALILWLALWLSENEWMLHERTYVREWVPLMLAVGIPVGLVIIGRDLGTTIVTVLMLFCIFLVAGMNSRILSFAAVIAAVLGVVVMFTSSSRVERVMSWINGCSVEDYEGICWQSQHGLWALGTGGLFGLGPGSSHAKWSWLPHAESDYIFAIVGEEWGLVGSLVVLLIIGFMGVTLVKMIREYDLLFTRLILTGVFVWLTGQSLINIAVVVGVLPVLGVPLPFLSSGGSSLLANLMAVGLAISAVRSEEADRRHSMTGVRR